MGQRGIQPSIAPQHRIPSQPVKVRAHVIRHRQGIGEPGTVPAPAHLGQAAEPDIGEMPGNNERDRDFLPGLEREGAAQGAG